MALQGLHAGSPCSLPSALCFVGTLSLIVIVHNPGFLHHLSPESPSTVIGRGVSIRSEGEREMQTWERLGTCKCSETPVPLLIPYRPIAALHTMSLTSSRDGIEKTRSGTQQSKILWVLLSLLRKLGLRIEFSFFRRKEGIYFKPTSKNIKLSNIIAQRYQS